MPVDWFPLWLSLRVAFCATVISLVLGLWLAWVLARRSFAGREIIQAVATFPYALPPLIAGTYCIMTLAHSEYAFTWHVGMLAGAVSVFRSEIIQAVATFPYALPPLIAGTYCIMTLAHSEYAFTWHVGMLAGAVSVFPL